MKRISPILAVSHFTLANRAANSGRQRIMEGDGNDQPKHVLLNAVGVTPAKAVPNVCQFGIWLRLPSLFWTIVDWRGVIS